MALFGIRWGIRRDLPQILAIENRCFEYPWSEETFRNHMRQRDCVLMVAENETGVVGYCLYYLHKQAIEIANLAVHPGFRWQGVGRRFVYQLQKKLLPDKRRTLFGVVWERNLAAQLFLRACDFKCRRVINNHFLDTGDDAYEFVFRAPVMAGQGREIECNGR